MKEIFTLLKYISLIFLIPFLLLHLTTHTNANAAVKKTFTPKISLRNQYDDNIDLEAENTNSGWMTTVSPGLLMNVQSSLSQMILDYESGLAFYHKESFRDNTRHRGTLRWEQQLSRSFKLHVRDTYIHEEDPIMESEEGQIEEILTERNIYYRNNGQVSLLWQFGAENKMSLGYINRSLERKSSRYGDSAGHDGFLQLDTWFIPKYGLSFKSGINRGEFEQSEDFYQYEGELTLYYRPGPSKNVFLKYDLIYQEFDESGADAGAYDFRVHQGSLGLNLALNSFTTFSIEGGYFVRNFLIGWKKEGGTFNLAFNKRMERASVRLEGSGGYDQDYFSGENLGSSSFRQAFAYAHYQVTRNFGLSSSADYRWEEFLGPDNRWDRRDEVWRATAGLSYSFWRWITLSFHYTHSERESNSSSLEFKDNRFAFLIVGAYPVSF
ncbi:MAG: hypothetical protein ACMUIP_08120 [bacterium]